MGCYSSSPAFPSHSSEDHVANAFHKKYILGKKLSSFGYGEVYSAAVVRKGKHAIYSNQAAYGVKIIDLQLGQKVAKCAAHEVSRWKMVGKHEHIAQLREVFYADACGRHLCYMVMDACGCTLLEYLDRAPILNERVLGECFAPMLMGLEFMHGKSFIHRGVEPGAFRMGGDDRRTLKLGEFGNSVVLGREKVKGECGKPLYMAPEMILGESYDEKVDVWSLGVLVYILLFGGKLPYAPKEGHSCSDIKLAISSNQVEPNFSSPVCLSGSAVAFTMCLLERNPWKRPSASDALKKSYMTSVMEARHEMNVDLPCLRFGLIHAKQTKAFETRDKSNATGIEGLLDRMQLEAFGIGLPSCSGFETNTLFDSGSPCGSPCGSHQLGSFSPCPSQQSTKSTKTSSSIRSKGSRFKCTSPRTVDTSDSTSVGEDLFQCEL